jgi:hypothetical protein
MMHLQCFLRIRNAKIYLQFVLDHHFLITSPRETVRTVFRGMFESLKVVASPDSNSSDTLVTRVH